MKDFKERLQKGIDAINGETDVNNEFFFSTNENQISLSEMKLINGHDRVFSLNPHSYKLLKKSGYKGKIHNINPVIDMPFINMSELKINESKDFNFLTTISDFEDMEIVEAFLKSFRKDDNVSLIVKYNGDSDIYNQYRVVNKIKETKSSVNKNGADIIFIGSKMNDMDYMRLFGSCDCFVKTNDIGIGEDFIKALSRGSYIIGPSHSVVSHLVSKERGFLVRKKTEKRNNRGMPFNVYSNDEVAKAMKRVYSKGIPLKEKNLKNRKLLINDYDLNIVSLKFLNLINPEQV